MRVRVCYMLIVTTWLAFVADTTQRTLWAVVAAGSYVTKPAQPEEKNQALLDALARFRNQDVEGAELLREAVAKDVELPPVHVILCSGIFRPTKHRPLAFLWSAVLEQPSDPESYVVMSDVALRDGRFTEAELALEKATAVLEGSVKTPRRKQLRDAARARQPGRGVRVAGSLGEGRGAPCRLAEVRSNKCRSSTAAGSRAVRRRQA